MINLPSTKFSLNITDFAKGVLMAILVPALLAIQQGLQKPPIDWKAIGVTSLVTFIGYLLKNFFTNDVPYAEKIISEAQSKAIEKLK